MTLSDITNKISFLTGANTTNYTNADRLININTWYNKFHSIILSSQDDWDFHDKNKTTYPFLTTNLIASQQDYQLPTTILKIKRVEAKLDGTNWDKFTKFDINQTANPTDSTSVSNNFDATDPYYDVDSGSLFLYPIPTANVTGGLKVWIHETVTEFTSSDLTAGTAVPGFDVLFHEYLAYGPSYDWAVRKNANSAERFKRELLEIEERARDFYGSKNVDGIYKLSVGTTSVDYK